MDGFGFEPRHWNQKWLTRTELVGIVLLLAIHLTGLVRASAQHEETEPYADEDYAIVAVALEGLYSKEDVNSVLVVDRTSMNLPPGVAAAAQTRQQAAAFFQDVPEEVRHDFIDRNRHRAKLQKGRIKARIRIILVSEETVTTLLKESGGWTALREKYPGPGTFLSSRDQALVTITTTQSFMSATAVGLSVVEARIFCLARQTETGKS